MASNTNKLFIICFSILIFSSLAFGQECTEGQTKTCGFNDIGECSFGTQACLNGQWSICFGSVLPSEEVCDDGLDNDCDGEVDEGCECESGETRSCNPGGFNETGICVFGVETCSVNNEWSGECFNATGPASIDLCGADSRGNDLDDDCDGEIDEDCLAPLVNQSFVDTCTNRVQDGNETGIDCGGTCPSCNNCTDGVKERDEEKVNIDLGNGVISDCGGYNCPSCPTCFDQIQNQGEEGVDCDGPCAKPCENPQAKDDDNDGLSYALELEKGTDPNKADTDGDGVIDSQDGLPLCPNLTCDEFFGENEENCPEDCKEGGLGASFWIIIVVIVVVLLVAFFLYSKFNSSVGKTSSSSTNKPSVGGSSPKKMLGGGSSLLGGFGRKATRPKPRPPETEAERRLRQSIERIKRR